jgi:hypothetical protein
VHRASQPNPLDYFFEMLGALNTADDRTSFYIRCTWAIIPCFCRSFSRAHPFSSEARGFPDLKYTRKWERHSTGGQRSSLAHRYDLTTVLTTLAERFGATRLALNDISERLFSLGDPITRWRPFCRHEEQNQKKAKRDWRPASSWLLMVKWRTTKRTSYEEDSFRIIPVLLA